MSRIHPNVVNPGFSKLFPLALEWFLVPELLAIKFKVMHLSFSISELWIRKRVEK